MELASYPALSVSWFAPGNVVSECACLVSQSCLTLCNHMGCRPPGSSVCGLSQTRILEWVAITLSRGSSWPRDQTCISCIGRWILYCWAIWEVQEQKCLQTIPSFWSTQLFSLGRYCTGERLFGIAWKEWKNPNWLVMWLGKAKTSEWIL